MIRIALTKYILYLVFSIYLKRQSSSQKTKRCCRNKPLNFHDFYQFIYFGSDLSSFVNKLINAYQNERDVAIFKILEVVENERIKFKIDRRIYENVNNIIKQQYRRIHYNWQIVTLPLCSKIFTIGLTGFKDFYIQFNLQNRGFTCYSESILTIQILRVYDFKYCVLMQYLKGFLNKKIVNQQKCKDSQRLIEKMPIIECDRHKGSYIQHINLDLEKGRTILCPECNEETDIPQKDLIPLIRLFKSGQDNLITKCPMFRNKEILSHVSNESQQKTIKDKVELVTSHFNSLKDQMIEMIEETKQSIISHIYNVSEKANLFTKELRDILSVQSLQNCVKQNHKNISQLEEGLQYCINKANNYLSQNEKNILKRLNEIENYEKQFELRNMYELSKKLIDYYKNQEYLTTISLLPSLDVVKSSHEASDNCKIRQLENKQIIIQNDQEQDIWRQVYVQYTLIPSDKYEIDILLSRKQEIMLGLIPVSNLNTYGWMNNLSLYTDNQRYGITKVIKGYHFSNYDKLNKITFQICLKQKVLRCFGDVFDIENVIELDNPDNINQNEQYYFYISQRQNYSVVQITKFNIVGQFLNN